MENLKYRKLRAEVSNLEKRFISKPSFWFGVVTALAAIVGIIGQSYLTKIEQKEAAIEVKQALAKKHEAEIQRDASVEKAAEARKDLVQMLMSWRH